MEALSERTFRQISSIRIGAITTSMAVSTFICLNSPQAMQRSNAAPISSWPRRITFSS